MNKAKLILQILKLNPAGAYLHQGEYIGNPEWITAGGDWFKPFSKYVNCHSKIIGTTGGPSEGTIRDISYSWNKSRLLKATVKELEELKKATKSTNNMYIKLFGVYSKGKDIFDFLNINR